MIILLQKIFHQVNDNTINVIFFNIGALILVEKNPAEIQVWSVGFPNERVNHANALCF